MANSKAKQYWIRWLRSNDAFGKLFGAEPVQEDCVTQAGTFRQYDLKVNDLIVLELWKKP